MASVELFRGNPGPVINIVEVGAANAFYCGDIVKTDGSGLVLIADADNLFGIARTTAAGSSATAQVELFNPCSVYKVYYKASAITAALVGDTIDMTDFTPGAQLWDETGATTDAVVVELIDPVDTVGGAIGVVIGIHAANR